MVEGGLRQVGDVLHVAKCYRIGRCLEFHTDIANIYVCTLALEKHREYGAQCAAVPLLCSCTFFINGNTVTITLSRLNIPKID